MMWTRRPISRRHAVRSRRTHVRRAGGCTSCCSASPHEAAGALPVCGRAAARGRRPSPAGQGVPARGARLDGGPAARGFWIVLLPRLSPLFPFNLLNYAYGATAVRPRDYITGSWLGMLPATVLYVYAGSAAASLAQALAGGALAGRTAAL